MARYLPIIIVALLMIYCVVEVAQAQPYAVRRMPRWLWATVVICVPLFGALAWLFFGRPNAESLGTRKRSTPRAPDDDVDFLRGLVDRLRGGYIPRGVAQVEVRAAISRRRCSMTSVQGRLEPSRARAVGRLAEVVPGQLRELGIRLRQQRGDVARPVGRQQG